MARCRYILHPMTFPELTYPVVSSERTVYIDGLSIDEIALSSGDTERMEYEDVLLGFDRTPDEFTYNMYKDLLAVIYRGRVDDISLWDDVESRYAGGSERLGIGDLPREFANKPDEGLMMGYLFEETRDLFRQEAILSENAVDRIVAILKMDRALINDVDRERAQEIIGHFEAKGCDRFDDLGDLIDIFIKTPTRDDIYGPRMSRLNSSLVCQHRVVLDSMKDYFNVKSADDLDQLRQKKKNITYTNFNRMIQLETFFEMLADRDPKRRFNDVLVVGPGLEQMNPDLRESVPRQSFEPFAVIDGLLRNGMSDLDDINVDLIDINDRVVAYFDGLVQRAIESGYLTLYCTSTDSMGSDDTGNFGLGLAEEYVSDSEVAIQMSCERAGTATARIHPDVVKRLKMTDENIITDRIAPDGSYDMIVMLNTFMYFTPEEKAIALENLSRLLVHGGVLITDVDRESIANHPELTRSPTPGGIMLKTNIYKKE